MIDNYDFAYVQEWDNEMMYNEMVWQNQLTFDPIRGEWVPKPVDKATKPKEIDPKSMAVVADTEEDRDRLWKALVESARGT